MSDLSRRGFLGATAAGVAAAAGAAGAQAPKKRPNVLYFFPDQVRAQAVGCYGGKNIPTPNIDRLASQGVRFTNALSTYPLCTPYRAMLQTGRWPALSCGIMNWVNLPPTGESMANAFDRAGYDTGFIGKWHLAAGQRKGTLKRGVPPPPQKESEFVPPGPLRHGYQHWEAFNFHVSFAHAWYYRDTPERLYMPKYETDSETDMAIEYMKRHKDSDKPFFLVVAPHPPHPPWRKDHVPPASLAETPEKLYWRPNVKGRLDSPQRDPRCYYAMIDNVDDNVGRLLDFLDTSGLAENTIVVFSSDHGEMLASQGRYNKMVPYAEAVDIPLIIRWPGHIRPGVTSDVLYTPMDQFPTLAGLCGVEVPDIVNGMDLSARVLGRKGPERDAALMMNFVSHWDYPETMTEWPEWRGIRTKEFTYVKWLTGAEELYDNIVDPYQMRNLCDGRSEPAIEFLPGNRYAEWMTVDRDFVRNADGPLPRA